MIKSQKILVSFLLVLFAFVQTGSLHELAHDDDSISCEVCELVAASEHQLVPPVEIATITPPYIEPQYRIKLSGCYAFAKADTHSFHHTTRPPPAMI
ncbi:MAG: hypothetical protein WBA16_11380 [Nonlabens sp.]